MVVTLLMIDKDLPSFIQQLYPTLLIIAKPY